MLKLGICDASQDTPRQRLWRRGGMSAALLAMSDPPSADELARFERLMPHISLANGVARTTSRGRFADLDREIDDRLRKIFSADSAISVHDHAISSGVTALEWFERLRAYFPRVQFTGSDAVLYLIEAARPDRGDAYILEPDGLPVQYVRRPFVVSLAVPHSRFYAVNRRIQARALRDWNESLAGALLLPDWSGVDGPGAPVSAPPFVLRRLPLLHPDVLASRGEAFLIRQHSIFDPLPRPVEAVRSMNILNRAYFSNAQLEHAVCAIKRSLKPCGIWIAGRTVHENPPRSDATIFQRHGHGWRILARFGEGWEMEYLASVR